MLDRQSQSAFNYRICIRVDKKVFTKNGEGKKENYHKIPTDQSLQYCVLALIIK